MNERLNELIKQAGLDDEMFPLDDGWETPALTKFAELVRADEREACAQLCYDLDPPPYVERCGKTAFWELATLDCAFAIRERSET